MSHETEHQSHNRTTGIWSRSYVLALAANFLAFFIVTSFVLYPLLIKNAGGSDTDIGVIMGIFSIVAVVLRPLAGLAAERFGSRSVTIFGIAVMTAVVPLFGLVEGRGWQVIVLRALLGVGWSCVLAPLMALATNLTPAEHLSESLGIFGISGLTAHATAPVVAELVVAASGFKTLFLINAVLGVVALALVIAIRPSGSEEKPDVSNSVTTGNSKDVLRLAIAGVVILATFHGAIRGINVNFIVPYAVSLDLRPVLGFSVASPFFVAFSIAAMLTRFKLASLPDRLGRRRVIIPTALVVAFNGLLISQIDSTPMLILAGLLGGLGQGLIFPALSSLMVDLIGHHRRAFALSMYVTCFEIGFGIGLPLFGLVADAQGYRTMFGLAGLLMAMMVAVFAWLVPTRLNRVNESHGRH